MNKTEARRIARERSAQIRAAREEAARREREEADRIQRERDEANEDDLVEFFQLDAALESAREVFEALVADTGRKQNAVIARVYAREKKAAVVAELVSLSPARVTAMRKAHEQAEKTQPSSESAAVTSASKDGESSSVLVPQEAGDAASAERAMVDRMDSEVGSGSGDGSDRAEFTHVGQ